MVIEEKTQPNTDTLTVHSSNTLYLFTLIPPPVTFNSSVLKKKLKIKGKEKLILNCIEHSTFMVKPRTCREVMYYSLLGRSGASSSCCSALPPPPHCASRGHHAPRELFPPRKHHTLRRDVHPSCPPHPLTPTLRISHMSLRCRHARELHREFASSPCGCDESQPS